MTARTKRPPIWRFYTIFFVVILLSILLSQLLVHHSIQQQRKDGHLINISGRQRMLSQKIAKLALRISIHEGEGRPHESFRRQLRALLEMWSRD